MKKLLKITAAVVAALLALAVFAGCVTVITPVSITVAALKGPTGMGLAGLMQKAAAAELDDNYDISLYAAPTDIVGLVAGGKVDIAAVPSNVAATLYKKTEGKVRLIAINTLGVLYLLTKDESIKSVKDLEGKTVVTSGQGATPEYVTDFILEKNGVKNCALTYLGEHAEVVTQAVTGGADTVLLPEPFVSTLLSKNAGFRIAIDINEEWEKVSDAALSMGVLIASEDFCKNNPEALARFLKAYAESVSFVNGKPDEAAVIIAENGIVGSEELAKSAIPNCNIVCITGNEMKTRIKPFLELLFEKNAASVGGQMPDEEFYYVGS